jgi:catechol 2,3-dioxygenase-like lactoylglutathione lyase family enzyme
MNEDKTMTKLSQPERNAAESAGNLPRGGFAPLVPELDVTDLETSLAFWCDVLGFTVAYDRRAAKFAYLEREGAQIMLCEINGEWVTGALTYPFGRGINFQIATTNVAPIIARIEAVGWPLFRAVSESWYRAGSTETGNREFLVMDPDGYLLRFSQNIGIRQIPTGNVNRAG